MARTATTSVKIRMCLPPENQPPSTPRAPSEALDAGGLPAGRRRRQEHARTKSPDEQRGLSFGRVSAAAAASRRRVERLGDLCVLRGSSRQNFPRLVDHNCAKKARPCAGVRRIVAGCAEFVDPAAGTKFAYRLAMDDPTDPLTREIIGAAIDVSRGLGPGLLESAYEACMAHELISRGMRFERQKPLPVAYKGVK